MPFPFLPAGLVLAAAVLGGAYAAFTLLLRAFDRAALQARNSIAPGIVAGLRGWSSDQAPERRTSSPVIPDVALGAFHAGAAGAVGPSSFPDGPVSGPDGASGGEMVELDDAQGVPLEVVHRR